LVNKDPIAVWEDAYRRYEEAPETEVASASRAVAVAWRNLAAISELPWWLLAAVHSAAESFDFQADAWEAAASRAAAALLPDGGNVVDPNGTRHTWAAVVLPTARRPTNGCRVLAEATPRGHDDGEDQADSNPDD
jgi:lysozyme family protein